MFYGGSVMPRFVMIYRVNTVHDKVLPEVGSTRHGTNDKIFGRYLVGAEIFSLMVIDYA